MVKPYSICAAKTRSKRVPEEEELCGWDVARDRRVGYVLEITDGRCQIHLLQTEHGPPTEPPEIVERWLDDVYRVCGQPSLSTASHGRCYFHQGGPSGPRNGNFRHGGYSKHLPTRIAADFEAIRDDPERAEIRYDVALVQTRIIELLGRVERGESGQLWDQLFKASEAFMASVKAGNSSEVKTAVERIHSLTTRGKGDMEVWAEIVGLVDIKRRLVEAQARIEEKRGRQVTVEKAYTLLAYVETGIRKAVEAHAGPDEVDLILGSFSAYMRAIYHGGPSVVEGEPKRLQ